MTEYVFVMGYKCRTCRHRGHDFRTVNYDTMSGMEFDVECPRCGSDEADETTLRRFKKKAVSHLQGGKP